MRKLLKTVLLAIITFGMIACAKKNQDIIPNERGEEDHIEAEAYTFNTAIKQFEGADGIKSQITGGKDIQSIYTYLLRTGRSDSLIHILDTRDQTDKRNLSYSLETRLFASFSMDQVSGLRLMIKRSDNSSDEGFIAIKSFTPALPFWDNIPASLLPDETQLVQIKAVAHSDNKIVKIELYDDYQGNFVKVDERAVDNEKEFVYEYAYTYRPNAANLKLLLFDAYGLSAEALISMPVLPFELFKDVQMRAQGNNTVTFDNNALILPDFRLIGPCSFADNEGVISFFTYNTSNGVTFYAPSNVGNVLANFKCNGTAYTPLTSPANWTATRFRVLLPSDAKQQAIYAAYNSNAITTLSDDFFEGISLPSTSTVRYSSTAAPAANIFNTSEAYLIWVRLPIPQGGDMNALIRIHEVTENGNTSSLRFDLLAPKN